MSDAAFAGPSRNAGGTQRFYTLDAIRGLAALIVIVYHSDVLHSAPCRAPNPCEVRFGYLAVDLFFMLSGFVLAYAYDARLRGGMGSLAFMRVRAIRLLPIYWLGSLAGFAMALLDCAKGRLPVATLLAAVPSGLVMVPSPVRFTDPAPFPLDPPAWSLAYEFWVANLLFALTFRFMTVARSLVLAAVMLGALVWVGLGTGTMAYGPGWDNLLVGVARTLFGFFVGVAVQRARPRLPQVSLPSIVVLVVAGLTFLPRLHGMAALAWEFVAIALIFPVLVHAGAGAVERRPRLGALVGDLSYALYLVHFPLLWLFVRAMYFLRIMPGWLFEAFYIIVCITISCLISTFYDPFLRKILSHYLNKFI